LGFLGDDVVATLDMGRPTEIRGAGANFLQSTRWGIVLPRAVEVSVSDDGRQFRTLKTLKPEAASGHCQPRTTRLLAADLKARARYVRVRAVNRKRLTTSSSW